MARTPSKITKRDIDKDLYLEIVSEASNETNVQKLLDEYVRKDEGIAEWQLPTQYRKNLTQKINALDSDIQGMKNDTTQKDWNADIAKRLAVVEEKEGIKVEGDSGVSPIIGTQVASNTLGISKNGKEIDVLKGQFNEFSQKFDVHENKNENDHSKLQIEFNMKLQDTSDQIMRLQDSVYKKRNVTDLITEDDLDDNIRKNMHTILNLGDKTLSAIDNMDSLVKRVDDAEKTAQKASTDADSALKTATGMMTDIEQTINQKVANVEEASRKSTENLHTSIEQYRTDATVSIVSVQDQINSLRDKHLKNTSKIAEINDKIENTAKITENNAVNISGNFDQINEIKVNAEMKNQAIENRLDNIQSQINNMHLFQGIRPGSFLSVLNEDGSIGGKDIVRSVYLAEDAEQLKMLMENTASPIYYKNSDYIFTIRYSLTEDGKVEPESDISSKNKTSDISGEKEDGNPEGSAINTEETSNDTEDNAHAINIDGLGISEYMSKYNGASGFMERPENRNVFIYDIYSNTIAAYVDGEGKICDFYTRPMKEKQYELVINADETVNYFRKNKNCRMNALVLIMDKDSNSPTYNKWINSEGVITVAYSDDAYMLHNNSHEQQQVRIYME